MSKEIIIALMRDKPKHYSKMIQCNPELKSWVIDNAIIKTDNFAELIYSAIHPKINPRCDLGNKKLFKGMTDGYSFCGTGSKCACLQELQRNNTSEMKAKQTPEQKIAEAEKIKQTNLKRYGVENPAQSKEIYAKIKATNLEKYGAESPLQNAQVLEKFKNTNLERYGVEWSQQNREVKQKSLATMIDRYGVKTPLEHAEFLKKAGDTCFENHGVRIPALSKDVVNRMIETNIERYGARAPTLNSTIFDKGIQTNLERYGVESKKQIAYSDELLELIESKELLTEMIKTHTVLDISIKYNVTLTTIYKYLKKHDVSLPVGDKTKFEKDVYAFVEENYDGLILGTDKTILYPKHLDIYLPELNLAIECNGTYWHSELRGRGENYHMDKTNECLAKGISLIHVWEHDWIAKRGIIESMILHRLGKSKSIFARRTTVSEISSAAANEFYEKNHLQGKCLASVHLGLYFDNDLVSCMSFGKSRFNKKYEYELIRYTNKTNHTVVGGASKLFTYFIKTHEPTSIISYAAKGHTTGNVYLQLGMTHLGVSKPSYSYTRDFVTIHNRQKFQKHKLEKVLEDYDPKLTEKDNMLVNGYIRLWDSGNDIFVWDNS